MAVLAHKIPGAYLDALKALDPTLDIRHESERGRAEDIRLVLVWGDVPPALDALPNLIAVQGMGAGVDHLLAPGVVPDQIPIARVALDVQAEGMSEYVVLHVLRQHRCLDLALAEHKRAHWQWRLWPRARSVGVGILGLGNLGQDAALKLAQIGFKVRGWSRSPKTLPGVECFAGAVGLGPFLSGCNHLVCLLPLTADTENILNRDLFAQLPRGAFLINAGRGQQLCEADLLEALDSGQLAGATLDVMRVEPVPPDHSFWARPEILITPHSAVAVMPEDLAPFLLGVIRRAEGGLLPENLVDRTAGY